MLVASLLLDGVTTSAQVSRKITRTWYYRASELVVVISEIATDS